METRKSNNITETSIRKDNNTSNRPSDRKQGKRNKPKKNKYFYVVFGRMVNIMGEEQDTADKNKNMEVEKTYNKNIQRKVATILSN